MYKCYYNVQLLDQSTMLDNLVQESCQHPHYPCREICIVQVVVEPKNLSALWKCEVSAFGSILKKCIGSSSIGTASSDCVSEVSAIERCPLREVPLYAVHQHNCYLLKDSCLRVVDHSYL